jgi:hypothetical protein
MSMSPFFYAVGLYTWTASNFLRSCYCAPPETSHVCGIDSTRSFRIGLLLCHGPSRKKIFVPTAAGHTRSCTSSALRPPQPPGPDPPWRRPPRARGGTARLGSVTGAAPGDAGTRVRVLPGPPGPAHARGAIHCGASGPLLPPAVRTSAGGLRAPAQPHGAPPRRLFRRDGGR